MKKSVQFSLGFRHIKIDPHQKGNGARTFQDNNIPPDNKTWATLSDMCDHMQESHSTVH